MEIKVLNLQAIKQYNQKNKYFLAWVNFNIQ